VAVSGRREREASFFTVVVWHDQAEHGHGPAPAAKLDAEDGSARSTVEVVAEELGPSLRWATAVRSYRSWPALIESGPFGRLSH
jgi:single-stranded DNA-binding protein